jgi:hypothetical protein
MARFDEMTRKRMDGMGDRDGKDQRDQRDREATWTARTSTTSRRKRCSPGGILTGFASVADVVRKAPDIDRDIDGPSDTPEPVQIAWGENEYEECLSETINGSTKGARG